MPAISPDKECVMANTKAEWRDGKWDSKLQCAVQKLQYDFRTKTGRLEFPEGDCCDMSGAISLFAAIDKDVRVIDTYAGGKPDTIYRRGQGSEEWVVFLRGE
jgi:hypothetical protein